MISSSRWLPNSHQILSGLAIVTALMLCSCQQIRPKTTAPEEMSGTTEYRKVQKPKPLTPPEEIKMLSEAIATEYRIGEGDVLNVVVWYRPELSNPQALVAPDGVVSIPKVGEVSVTGMTREEAAENIKKHVSKLYIDPDVTVTVLSYKNNSLYVLGRVRNPGIIHFPGPPTLVEALTRAGGIGGG